MTIYAWGTKIKCVVEAHIQDTSYQPGILKLYKLNVDKCHTIFGEKSENKYWRGCNRRNRNIAWNYARYKTQFQNSCAVTLQKSRPEVARTIKNFDFHEIKKD